MKTKYITITSFLLSLVFLSLNHAYNSGHGVNGRRKSTGPPACHAGEPPNNMTCQTSGCHSTYQLNSGTAQLNLDLGGAENGYTSGEDYTITVTLFKTGLMRGGFQIIALQDNNDTISPGVFTIKDNIRTQRIDKNNPHAHHNCAINSKVWIEHSDGGIDDVFNDSISWEFDWQAPSNNVGSITFYVASVEANVDFDATGDYVYSKSTTISSSTGINEKGKENKVTVYPNPVSDFLQFDIPETALSDMENSITIYNLEGKTVLKSTLTQLLQIQHLSNGKYIVSIQLDGALKSFLIIKI